MRIKAAYQLLALAALLVSAQAQAAYDVYVYQNGQNVEAYGSGSINLSALTPAQYGHTDAFIQSLPAALAIGSSDASGLAYEGRITGPFEAGSDFDAHHATKSQGDLVAIAGILHRVVVPQHYVSGEQLTSSAFWRSQTIAGLGFTPGSYTWTWGTGGTQDSFTVHIGPPPPAGVQHIGE